MDSLPDLAVPVSTMEAGTQVTRLVPFDRARVFTYAYRHCYAQRHADAGVPPDVLKELMDHRLITTTHGYDRMARNGAAKPATGSRPPVRPARQPGLARRAEPAGLRARCLGCEHFSTDVSYLPTSRPTSPTCSAAGNS
ncbi:hypothetical protein [Streptomyces sp. NBC_01565]|uniref:hypothetical protein n=1 Tax=unclassified Streptomyces TaxID=2593676 RepID=UPI0022563AF0|nr:hypothetical protein [Streptomyces sp. NBC_01565]MCX4539087.1 hypothetical protein [Streptomyces sp. NBC_01565]